MFRKSLILSILILSFVASSQAQALEEALDLQRSFVKVAEDIGPAVVSITTLKRVETYYRLYPFNEFEDEFFRDFFGEFFVPGPQKAVPGIGSGFIIDKDGYILTNEHVIRDAYKITVTLPDGSEYEARLTGSDIHSDLAVVKIEPEKNLPVAKLGDSDRLKIGEWAVAIGNPFGITQKNRNPEPTITVGVISALHRSLARTDARAREFSDLIQTDAAINPGNSGGPLVNIRGEVIGINVAIVTRSGGFEGIGFAVPVNNAKRILEDLMQGREALYGWIGVVIQDLNEKLAAYFGLKDPQGVLVSRVLEGSPAEKAGLKPGDIAILFDNEKIRNTQDLIREVLKKDVGDEIKLDVVRNRKRYTFLVEVGVRPEQEKTAKAKTPEVLEGEEIGTWRGLEVSGITQELSDRFRLKEDSGVIVIGVEDNSPALASGIRVGDVIFEIDRNPIRNMSDYRKAIRGLSGDALVGTHRGYVIIKR